MLSPSTEWFWSIPQLLMPPLSPSVLSSTQESLLQKVFVDSPSFPHTFLDDWVLCHVLSGSYAPFLQNTYPNLQFCRYFIISTSCCDYGYHESRDPIFHCSWLYSQYLPQCLLVAHQMSFKWMTEGIGCDFSLWTLWDLPLVELPIPAPLLTWHFLISIYQFLHL